MPYIDIERIPVRRDDANAAAIESVAQDHLCGIAEQMILRDRFYRCGVGVVTSNWNTLDVYIWHSYFEDNWNPIRNNPGDLDAKENPFLRSPGYDLELG